MIHDKVILSSQDILQRVESYINEVDAVHKKLFVQRIEYERWRPSKESILTQLSKGRIGDPTQGLLFKMLVVKWWVHDVILNTKIELNLVKVNQVDNG